MTALAPTWAFGAQAIDGVGDTHIQPGINFRVMPSPRLGLPMRPLVVYRSNLGTGEKHPAMRYDINWFDSHGTPLTPPFDVHPANPVTGYLPVGINSRCGWVRVDAKPHFKRPGFDPSLVDTILDVARNLPERRPELRPDIRPIDATTGRITRGTDVARSPAIADDARIDVNRINRDDLGRVLFDRDLLEFDRRIPELLLTSQLRVDAWKTTPWGPQVVGARTSEPYDIGASEIHGVTVSGSGRVYGGKWLDIRKIRLDQMTPWRLMALPVVSGARYEGIPNAAAEARNRVKRGFPHRFGLHDDPTVANAASAAAAAEADEEARLNGLAPPVGPLIDAVLNDTSVPPQDVISTDPLAVPTSDGSSATATYPCLASLLLASSDPTMARWLGFLDRDEAPTGGPGDVVMYVIRGFFGIDVRGMSLTDIVGLYYSAGGLVRDTTPDEPQLPFDIPRDHPNGQFIFDWWVPAITTVGAPPIRPPRPYVGAQLAPTDPPTADGQGHWNPNISPPDAARDVQLPVSGLLPAAAVAFARDEGASIEGLNRRFPVSGSSVATRAQDLMPGLPGDAGTPSEGKLTDREAPPDAIAYRIAQHDWFGRWSDWNTRSVPEKERPGPPPAVPNPEYTMVALPDPMHSNPLWGTLTVRVRVPGVDSLTPGGHLLASLRITGSIDGIAFTAVNHALPTAPADWPEEVAVVNPAPAGIIDRTASVGAVIQAQWIDTAGQAGIISDPKTVLCVDPRPPEPVVIDPTLKYSARPDATGRARVTLTWPVGAGQKRYRVYFCDETRLLDRLQVMADGDAPLPLTDPTPPTSAQQTAATQLLAAHTAAENPAARGAAFTDGARPQLLPRSFFQQLTGEPLEAGSGATPMTFQHELSGSLRALAFYRVVSVSANNVESDFASAPLVPFGVPNLGGPPQPMLEVVQPGEGDPELAQGSVRLRIRVARGTQPVVAYRLRRSGIQATDPRRMAVAKVDTITLDPDEVADTTTPLEFDVDDDGAYLHDAGFNLRPFTRYAWRVDVQAPSPPRSTVPGEWSSSSPPASTMLLPDAPSSPEADEVVVDASDATDKRATVRWNYDGSLDGGELGTYRFDLYKKVPGGREVRLATVVPDAGGATSFSYEDEYGTEDPVSSTAYRVVILDPSGRMSAPSDTLTIP